MCFFSGYLLNNYYDNMDKCLVIWCIHFIGELSAQATCDYLSQKHQYKSEVTEIEEISFHFLCLSLVVQVYDMRFRTIVPKFNCPK